MQLHNQAPAAASRIYGTGLNYSTKCYIIGFDRANIRQDELKALKVLAAELLGYSQAQLDQAVRSGALLEV